MSADPYRNFKFEVEIDGFVRAGFAKVSGLGHSINKIEYREGGENETLRKLPGRSDFPDITFERGMSNDNDFVNWAKLVYDVDAKDGKQGKDGGWRKTIVVYLKNKSGQRVKKWTILRAWPTDIQAGDLDASSSGDVLMETMTITNEGIKMENIAPSA